jgi:hypothetical protein
MATNAQKIVNKGTGAGGANTNRTGLSFEAQTNNVPYLELKGFTKVIMGKGSTSHYLQLITNEKEIYFSKKQGFKQLMKTKFGISVPREPDESYLIHDLQEQSFTLKIVEKKNQNVEGSVDEKLLAAHGIRRIYEKCFENNNVTVEYAFCLSPFFKQKFTSGSLKHSMMHEIMEEWNVRLLYGKDDDYFATLNTWIGIDLLTTPVLD